MLFGRSLLLLMICIICAVYFFHYFQYDISRFVYKHIYADRAVRRKLALSDLTEIIQRRIRRLQFPANCKNVSLLRCVEHDTGYGSQMHLRAICLMAAYTTNRTWVPDAKKPFNYSPVLGWGGYFQPVTNCTENDITATSNVIQIDSFNYRTSLMPQAFPSEFSKILLEYHPFPPLFWIAQFQWYLSRYQPILENYIDKKIRLLRFHEPIVGVHIRRGDKVRDEALLFEIAEYMVHVEAWFNRTFRRGDKRPRIFLLTDEQQLINQTIEMYPEYEFVYDLSPSSYSQHYAHDTLLDIAAGIHMLSRCTYVVCTFTSNVCRLAYEFAQLIRMDDSTDRFLSLDIVYYFWGQQQRYQIATDNHTVEGDMELMEGDVVEVNDSPSSKPKKRISYGFAYFDGKNLRTGQRGRYPISIVREKWTIVNF